MARILLVTNDFGPRAGGIETFIIGLLERLSEHEIFVYTSSQASSKSYDEEWRNKFGVRVIRDRSRILLPTPRVVLTLRDLIRKESIEVVWFGAAAPLGIAARWLRISSVRKIVALTHGHEVWWSKVPPFNFLMREIGKQVDSFGYLGDFTANALSKVIDRKKLVRMAPGIDTEHFRPLKEEKPIPTIISVGRLVHRKGQDRLVEALPLIKAAVPNVQLIFVGEGPHRGELDRLIEKHGVSDQVKFFGRVAYEDLPKVLSLGDVFAMPSRSRLFGLEVEGLGIVYLEASACGLPVIAGASGGAPDAVIEGETGYVVDGNDLNSIADRAIKLLTDTELRSRLGRRGRDWVVAEWRWEIWSREFNKLVGE